MSRPLIFAVIALAVSLCAFAIISFAKTRQGEPSVAIAPGWHARLDAVNNSQSTTVRFEASKAGFLASNGPNAVFFRDGDTVKGRYSLSAGVQHLESLHPHGAGLVFGGSDLLGSAQTYTYFLVRDDGYFLIKTRRGDETQDVMPWTKHDAVRPMQAKPAMAAQPAENVLRVDVGATETRFLVNEAEVHRAANTTLHVDGAYGFRMVHDLKIQFSELVCTVAK